MQRATLPIEIKRNSQTEFEPFLDSNEWPAVARFHPSRLASSGVSAAQS